ncbi:MAG: PspA/IM30 family protein [Iodobacter sp.]
MLKYLTNNRVNVFSAEQEPASQTTKKDSTELGYVPTASERNHLKFNAALLPVKGFAKSVKKVESCSDLAPKQSIPHNNPQDRPSKLQPLSKHNANKVRQPPQGRDLAGSSYRNKHESLANGQPDRTIRSKHFPLLSDAVQPGINSKKQKRAWDDNQRIKKWAELVLAVIIPETARYDEIFTTQFDASLGEERKNKIKEIAHELIQESKARAMARSAASNRMNTSAGSIALHAMHAFGSNIAKSGQDAIDSGLFERGYENVYGVSKAEETNNDLTPLSYSPRKQAFPHQKRVLSATGYSDGSMSSHQQKVRLANSHTGQSEDKFANILATKTLVDSPGNSASLWRPIWDLLGTDLFPIGPPGAEAAPIRERTLRQAQSELALAKENKDTLKLIRNNYMDDYRELIREAGREKEAYESERRADALQPQIESAAELEKTLKADVTRLEAVHLEASLSVHLYQTRQLAGMSASELTGTTAEQLQIDLLDKLNSRFSRDPEAMDCIGELAARGLGQYLVSGGAVDNILIDDLLSVGFPGVGEGCHSNSPAIVMSSMPASDGSLTSALHIITYGQLVGRTDSDTLNTVWGKRYFQELGELSEDFRSDYLPRLGAGIPPSAEKIDKPLKWAYGEICGESRDTATRWLTADARYKKLEQNLRLHFALPQLEIERDPNSPKVIGAMDSLRGAIAYLAYDYALFKGEAPSLSAQGDGYVGFVKMRSEVNALLNEIKTHMESKKAGHQPDPVLIANAKALTKGSLSALIGASLSSLLSSEAKKVADQFDAVLKPDSVIEIRDIWFDPELARLQGSMDPYYRTTETLSLSEMILKEVPNGSWYCVKNCGGKDRILDSDRDKIISVLTQARYDADTEVPFNFQRLMDEKRPELTVTLDATLQLHVQDFINNPAIPPVQKKLVNNFLDGHKQGYRYSYDGHAIYGSIFLPYNDNDHLHGDSENLHKDGLLYSPHDGFTWLQSNDNRLSQAQQKAMRNGMTQAGKDAFSRGLKEKITDFGYVGGFSDDTVDPLNRLVIEIGGVQIKARNLSGYLITSFSEYFDHYFSERHESLQEKWSRIQSNLQMVIGILSLAAIPVPSLGLVLAGGNIFVSIVTLTDPEASSSDKQWAIADLVFESLGAVGDVIALSKTATRRLQGALESFGADSPRFKSMLGELTQQALVEQKGPLNKLVGLIAGKKGKNWSDLSAGHLVKTSGVNGSCRGLAFSHAIGKLNGNNMDVLPSLFKQGDPQTIRNVVDMQKTQRVAAGRSPVSIVDAKQATRSGALDKGAYVAVDGDMTYSQAQGEMLAQIEKLDEVAFVIGTKSHAVSLTKGPDGITFFDPAEGIIRWPAPTNADSIRDVLDYVVTKYDTSLTKINGTPLSLTVLTKQPEKHFIYAPFAGEDPLNQALLQFEVSVNNGGQQQVLFVKDSAAKSAMQSHVTTLETKLTAEINSCKDVYFATANPLLISAATAAYPGLTPGEAFEKFIIKNIYSGQTNTYIKQTIYHKRLSDRLGVLQNINIETLDSNRLARLPHDSSLTIVGHGEADFDSLAADTAGALTVSATDIASDLKRAGLPYDYVDIRTTACESADGLELRSYDGVELFNSAYNSATTPFAQRLATAIGQEGFTRPHVRGGHSSHKSYELEQGLEIAAISQTNRKTLYDDVIRRFTAPPRFNGAP